MRSLVLPLSLAIGLGGCLAPREAPRPAKLLGNPVLEARAALAAGDSTPIGIFEADLELPGLDSAGAAAYAAGPVRAFSRRGLGLSASAWAAQRDSLRVYAAVYNRLILEARSGG